ncbi:hypothetical protein HY380_01400 [Candidatus Saccharibacteria bacterium]|nr:hypothetical protein [Candidatus Saccharibacteria bacterium]
MVAEQQTIRPTKKQKELLTFIETFIAEHGYSPSYREIMAGLNYTSVATVALHVNSLIKRGHLQKRDHSARSLEVVNPQLPTKPAIEPKQLNVDQEKWLVGKIEIYFKEAEALPVVNDKILDQLQVLIGALKVLGASTAAQAFATRLTKLKNKPTATKYSV